MSAQDACRAEWLDHKFWDRLDLIESRHQRIQSEHDAARRGLERLSMQDFSELREAWQRYCDIIAELDRTTAELEVLRTQSI